MFEPGANQRLVFFISIFILDFRFCLDTPLLPDVTFLNKDADPKRLGSENNAIKEAQHAHT